MLRSFKMISAYLTPATLATLAETTSSHPLANIPKELAGKYDRAILFQACMFHACLDMQKKKTKGQKNPAN